MSAPLGGAYICIISRCVMCVRQLDYKATKAKIEEIFRIAGNVIEIDLKTDKDGRSRGMCTVRYEHPMEAVQCIGILDGDVMRM